MVSGLTPTTPTPATYAPVRAWLAGFGPQHLRRLCREGERPAALTLLGALALLLRPGIGLTPAEVLLYGLHRPRRSSGGRVSRGPSSDGYIGEALWAARCLRLNRGANRLLTNKLTLSYLLAGSRVASPRTLAYLGVPNALLAVPQLFTRADLSEFLQQQAQRPLFLKPLVGAQGLGCIATDGLEPGDRGPAQLRLGNGARLPLQEAAAWLHAQLGPRAIVQERIEPHHQLRSVCGDTCATATAAAAGQGQD